MLSLVKMDRILEIDPVDRIAVVEPGVVNAVLSRAVAEQGLYYPPDPSSWEQCTIGGNIGTGSGGLCCVKYGVTAEYVLGLDVVLADGRLLHTGRRTAKGVAGYDLTRLFVGSEGSLGVVVRAVLALRPAPPQQLALAAEFPSVAAACDGGLRDHGGRPRTLPAGADGPHHRPGRQRHGPDGPAGHHRGPAAGRLRHPRPGRPTWPPLGALCTGRGRHRRWCPPRTPPSPNCCSRRGGCRCTALETPGTDHDDRRRVRAAVRGSAPMLEGVAAIADRYDLTIGVCAHAGDGNTHPVVCFDAADPDESRRARESFDEIMALGLELGGTITGEHGVGVLKKEWLARELGPVGLELQRGIKAGLRPAGHPQPRQALLTRRQ